MQWDVQSVHPILPGQDHSIIDIAHRNLYKHAPIARSGAHGTYLSPLALKRALVAMMVLISWVRLRLTKKSGHDSGGPKSETETAWHSRVHPASVDPRLRMIDDDVGLQANKQLSNLGHHFQGA